MMALRHTSLSFTPGRTFLALPDSGGVVFDWSGYPTIPKRREAA